MEIAKSNTGGSEVGQERCNAGPLPLRVIGVDQLVAIPSEGQPIFGERLRNNIEPSVQLKYQALLAEPPHQLGLVLDQNDFSLVDHTNAIRDLLGLVDIVRRSNDG